MPASTACAKDHVLQATVTAQDQGPSRLDECIQGEVVFPSQGPQPGGQRSRQLAPHFPVPRRRWRCSRSKDRGGQGSGRGKSLEQWAPVCLPRGKILAPKPLDEVPVGRRRRGG